MSNDTVIGLAIAAAAVIVPALITMLVLLVRMSMRWATMESRLTSIDNAVTSVRADFASADAELYAVVREDRHNNNERFTRLESLLLTPRRPGE
jgi:hypothetical protein